MSQQQLEALQEKYQIDEAEFGFFIAAIEFEVDLIMGYSKE